MNMNINNAMMINNVAVMNTTRAMEEAAKYVVLGKDFNPFNRTSVERFELELPLFMNTLKECIHVIRQAKFEGYQPQELVKIISKDDIAFLKVLNPSISESNLFDATDFVFIENPVVVRYIGNDFNPFNWDVNTRLRLVVGNMVGSFKSLCHIAIQAEKERRTMQELVARVDEETLQMLKLFTSTVA